jgi:hypothetical protein
MARLISKSQLALLARVTKGAISHASVKQFPDALIGGRVDLDHPDVRRYLAGRDIDPTQVENAATKAAVEATAPRPVKPSALVDPFAARNPNRSGALRRAISRTGVNPDVDRGDVALYLDMTLREIVLEHGTAPAFVDFLDARKCISDITEKDLKNAERVGRLIPREFVRAHVFAHIDAGYRRLLTDTAATIARRCYAAARTGQTIEEGEALVRELIGSQLQLTKTATVRSLREQTDPPRVSPTGAAP